MLARKTGTNAEKGTVGQPVNHLIFDSTNSSQPSVPSEVFDLELGALFGTRARFGLSAIMTYAGGAYIFARKECPSVKRLHFTLPGIVMEVENHLFVEKHCLPRGP